MAETFTQLDFLNNIFLLFFRGLVISVLLRIADFLFKSEYLTNIRSDPQTSQLIKLLTEVIFS